ncbi:MAG: hypothetical protein KIH08_12880 [Candidatus Freyarchaeota archaeon]|nr:hypothetical protein [Candidatus Jordarchaeia archaeon]MBS7269584.1 hypothetical protein [Candidatus Jordarchaeia archaeon]
MADANSRNSPTLDEPPIESKEAITSTLVKSGMSPQDADNLYCKLKAFPPKYHGMILKYAELSSEVQSTVLSLLEEQSKPERIEGEQTQTGAATPSEEQDTVGIASQSVSPEFVVKGELQKTEETLTEPTLQKENMVKKTLGEKLKVVTAGTANIAAGGETATIVQEVKEKEPSGKQKVLQGYSSLENDAESKKEMEEVLEQIEKSFGEMSLDEQEEIMPRYAKLKIFLCKDKRETDTSCIKCLINETIDCPLFKP